MPYQIAMMLVAQEKLPIDNAIFLLFIANLEEEQGNLLTKQALLHLKKASFHIREGRLTVREACSQE
ncbi:hypothetical protein [Marinifilum fragile]|uniref:hypothetical protein n=1 Tax=Marinifilum fragile TaxID=570161 RepID=UPI002AA7E715|nr:hypothetical protein [Marinifilum fragile]